MCKIDTKFLSYSHLLTAVANSTVSANFKINHPSDCTNYIINNDPSNLEKVTIYTNGLVIYTKQQAGEILTKSNYPFVSKDDGYIWIMNE